MEGCIEEGRGGGRKQDSKQQWLQSENILCLISSYGKSSDSYFMEEYGII